MLELAAFTSAALLGMRSISEPAGPQEAGEGGTDVGPDLVATLVKRPVPLLGIGRDGPCIGFRFRAMARLKFGQIHLVYHLGLRHTLRLL